MTGLTAQNFSIYVFDRPPGTPFKLAPPSSFVEVSDPPGTYGVNAPSHPTSGWGDEELVIVVDVAAGADHGRTLINPIITKP